MLRQLPAPAIFAHRGSCAHAPENTLAAFELALRQQADGIELDAKLTADGHVVVIHDRTVDRTTEGTGWVGKMTLAALRQLDAGSHFDVAFKGEPIPTLEEVFALVGRQTILNVELTNYSSPFDSLPEKIAALVERHGLAGRIMFSSFNPYALRRISRLVREAPIGLLALAGRRGAWARGWPGRLLLAYQALHPSVQDITADLVRQLHRLKRRVHVYGVNRADEMRRLFTMGVDGIFTDDPLLARRVLTTSDRIA